MAAAAGSPAKEELTVPPAAQPRRGASAGPTPTLLHDSALHSATSITVASTALITPESVAASLHSSVSSPTGTKLAVTTPSESPAGGEGARKTLDEEKKIALSQLQELEVAIKVRKVTKVDGRKVRWIEYRARKQAEEEKQPAHAKKRARRSKSKTKRVENSENEANVNNNNNNNNNSKTDTTMKGDSTSSPLSVVGTSNVLESMKQQFLQGTENIEEPIINGKSGILAESSIATQKRKSGRTRKSATASEGGSPSSTSPKKFSPSEASAKGACLRSCGASKGSSSANSSVSEAPLTLSSTPTIPFTSDQPLAIGIKKNFFTSRSLTKGLREVRKIENGTEGVSPVKVEEVKNLLISPSLSLHLTSLSSVVNDGVANEAKISQNSKLQSVETKGSKATCPLIKATAKLMSPPSARSKSADGSATKGKKGISQKGNVKKVSAKSVRRPETEPINGHNQMVQNGSSEEASHLVPAGSSSVGEPCSGQEASKQENVENNPGMPSNSDSSKKKTRGRPPKRKLVLRKRRTATVMSGKSGKKLATLVVDVHNTMNGEPQTVIPVSRPVLRGKKKASSSKNPQTAGKSPDIKQSPLPTSKRKKNEAKLAKLKLFSETPQTGSQSGSPHDTKKGKASKKNIEYSLDVKEEKHNTSASTVNQIQIPPDPTQSTKHTKAVQRSTNKEVPSVGGSNTAISSKLQSNKKKVRKPVLKVKTLPVKHKEIEKIIKKSKKAARGGISKQNRTQPKKNSIRKYLCANKGKGASKMISKTKKESIAQTNPKNSCDEDKRKCEEGVSHKPEETLNTDLMEVQHVEEDASLLKDSVLKTETMEIEVQKIVPVSKSAEEDSNLKADLAAEVPCKTSPTVPAFDYREESFVEEKPCITNLVPQNETETQPTTDENPTAMNILGLDKSYENVSDLPKISFQNDNINNNNAEEEGVVICDKEITVVKDLSVKKISTTDDALKCINNEECSMEEFASKTKREDEISNASVETVLELERTNIKDEEHETFAVDSRDCQDKDCKVEQNSFQDESSCPVELKSEENVCDKNESCVEVLPGGVDECQTPTHMVTLDNSEMQGYSTSKENMVSSPSHVETPKVEVPFLEAASSSAMDQSVPDDTTAATAVNEVCVEVVDEVSGCEKLSEGYADPEDKITKSHSFTEEEIMITAESMNAKENDSLAVMNSEVNSTLDTTESANCDLEIVEVQTGTLQDEYNADSVAPVSQKSSIKQTKRREGAIARRKMKKALVQSQIIAQLEHDGEDVQEENEDTKLTKAQETSQEASAVKTYESNEVLDTLPSSQKENDEVQEIIPEVQPSHLTSAPEVQSSSTTKTKEKVPRILKQLFQDEGVQNMLKSMSEDSGAAPETSPNSDSGIHKLRPKRITEPMLSSSPDLDAMEALLTSSRKKKRGSEVDTLYIDEGVLNLLTSKEHSSRRIHQEDAPTDVSQPSSSKSFKAAKITKSYEMLSDNRKRKLSGTSTSNTSSSSRFLQPPEPKKVRVEIQEPCDDPYELDIAEEFKEKPVILGYSNLETTVMARKKGLPLSVKKVKAIKMQLKVQKQKPLKSVVSVRSKDQEEGTSNIIQVPETLIVSKETIPEASSLPASVEAREMTSKSVPPLKIKLASDSVTIKPVPHPSLPHQSAEVTIIPKPPPIRLPIKPPQLIDSTSSPLPRALPLPQVRTSPEKHKAPPERHSPSPYHRRVENFSGPVPPAPGEYFSDHHNFASQCALGYMKPVSSDGRLVCIWLIVVWFLSCF